MLWIFAALFLIGVIGSGIIITRKIPLVLATPRQVIDNYFQQETARLHIRVLRIRAWFQRGEYWDPILLTLLRALRAVRIFALKLERSTFVLIQTVNGWYEERKLINGNGKKSVAEEVSPNGAPRFWNELKERAKDEN